MTFASIFPVFFKVAETEKEKKSKHNNITESENDQKVLSDKKNIFLMAETLKWLSKCNQKK